MKGMNGNDQLFARDLTSDTTINCDGGTAPGPPTRPTSTCSPRTPTPPSSAARPRRGTEEPISSVRWARLVSNHSEPGGRAMALVRTQAAPDGRAATPQTFGGLGAQGVGNRTPLASPLFEARSRGVTSALKGPETEQWSGTRHRGPYCVVNRGITLENDPARSLAIASGAAVRDLAPDLRLRLWTAPCPARPARPRARPRRRARPAAAAAARPPSGRPRGRRARRARTEAETRR